MGDRKTTDVHPRFSRGQERLTDGAEKRARPDFARGQETEPPTEHEGDFAAGQEHEAHHPEQELHGRFSRGQGSSDP